MITKPGDAFVYDPGASEAHDQRESHRYNYMIVVSMVKVPGKFDADGVQLYRFCWIIVWHDRMKFFSELNQNIFPLNLGCWSAL